MTTMTTMTKLYAHYTLPITATAPYWHALGFQPIDRTDAVGTVSYHRAGDVTDVLILGMAKTGANDERVLVWAMEEIQRRSEERSRSTAISQEAAAINNLAQSIRQTTDEQFLTRLFGKVSEKTAFAIRAQLRQNPL